MINVGSVFDQGMQTYKKILFLRLQQTKKMCVTVNILIGLA